MGRFEEGQITRLTKQIELCNKRKAVITAKINKVVTPLAEELKSINALIENHNNTIAIIRGEDSSIPQCAVQSEDMCCSVECTEPNDSTIIEDTAVGEMEFPTAIVEE